MKLHHLNKFTSALMLSGVAVTVSPVALSASPRTGISPSAIAVSGAQRSAAAGHRSRTSKQKKRQLRKPDVIYYPTPPETVDEMLRMAKIKKGDVLIDLGSGDGRIPIAAAKEYG